jgi:outer membrane biosynthesis protein TonB
MAELFADVEINRTPRWPRLLRLGIVSFVLHALFFAAFIYVPVLRDAFHIINDVSVAEYVDEDYEKTQILRGAVMVDASQKLQYPPGYFDMGKPKPEPLVVERATPVPTPRPASRPRPIPTPTPTPEPSPTPQPAVDPAEVVGELPKSDEERDKKLDKIAADNNVERPPRINSKPFKDALAKAKKKRDDGKLDLSGSIEIVVTADRNPDGSLRNVVPKVLKGDPNLVEVALDFVSALSDSHALVFLKDTNSLTMTVKANENTISASVESEVDTEARASQMANAFNVLVWAASKSDKDEAIYYKSTSVTSKGKDVIVNFSMPRATASALISKQLPSS